MFKVNNKKHQNNVYEVEYSSANFEHIHTFL